MKNETIEAEFDYRMIGCLLLLIINLFIPVVFKELIGSIIVPLTAVLLFINIIVYWYFHKKVVEIKFRFFTLISISVSLWVFLNFLFLNYSSISKISEALSFFIANIFFVLLAGIELFIYRKEHNNSDRFPFVIGASICLFFILVYVFFFPGYIIV